MLPDLAGPATKIVGITRSRPSRKVGTVTLELFGDHILMLAGDEGFACDFCITSEFLPSQLRPAGSAGRLRTSCDSARGIGSYGTRYSTWIDTYAWVGWFVVPGAPQAKKFFSDSKAK